jgi:hypothetical protein
MKAFVLPISARPLLVMLLNQQCLIVCEDVSLWQGGALSGRPQRATMAFEFVILSDPNYASLLLVPLFESWKMEGFRGACESICLNVA